jgi:4-hydroxybenzoate polyprenyltransferase
MEVQDLQDTSLVPKRHNVLYSMGVFFRDIKLSHSLFALPFVGVTLTMTGLQGVDGGRLGMIALCMVFARCFAMGMNRYLDKDLDALNIRTKLRALPAGRASSRNYLLVTLLCGVLFILVAFQLSTFVGQLSPIMLTFLASYSFMKRLSWLTHWYLGICLGLAPLATEIALFGRVSLPIALVGLAVAFWTAGFDLLYALQDREFDVSRGLHSVPARFGHRTAIWLSRACFLAMIVLLVWAGVASHAGVFWMIGVAFVALILLAEHWMIRDALVTGYSNKINAAFFNLNAGVSVCFFTFALLNVYAQSH